MLGWLRRWRAARAARAAAASERDEASADAAAAEREGEHEDEGEREGEVDDESADDDAPADPAAGAALADELDLHTFLPKECADVVEEYVRAAQEAGLPAVRIIHGKGTGTLRRIVHAVLDRHPAVRSYRLAGAARGSWGATLVELKPPADPPEGGGI